MGISCLSRLKPVRIWKFCLIFLFYKCVFKTFETVVLKSDSERGGFQKFLTSNEANFKSFPENKLSGCYKNDEDFHVLKVKLYLLLCRKKDSEICLQ